MSLNDVLERLKARGNFGHSGRPGKVGGSASGMGGGGATISGRVNNLLGKNVTLRVGNNSTPRTGILMKSGDGFKLIGRVTVYGYDQVDTVFGNTIVIR